MKVSQPLPRLNPRSLEYLDWISSRLGFESRYLVYPLLALLAGVIVKLLIRRHARKWAEKTKSGLHEKLLTFLDSSTHTAGTDGNPLWIEPLVASAAQELRLYAERNSDGFGLPSRLLHVARGHDRNSLTQVSAMPA